MSNSMMCTKCHEFFRLDTWNYCPCCGNQEFTEEWKLDEEGKLIE